MFLHTKLESRKDHIKIAFIGCGKFVSMFLAQYSHLNKIQIDSIVDINLDQAKKNCLNSGLSLENIEKIYFSNSLDDILDRDIEIFIEATGNPIIGTVHAKKIITNKKHIILVNVEADITCGKYLADLAKEKNVICSMAYGDQPSLILEQIEWARLNGFQVICAGKGTKYHPSFEYSTPDTVWGHYGLTKDRAENESGMNPKMFNSFLCGDKSAIEMCAVSNAANLKCTNNGLTFPPIGVYDIAKKMIPKKDGGLIDSEGQVEVISSIDLEKKELSKILKKKGLALQEGGRVINLTDKVNKAKALQVFVRFFKKKNQNIKTIAVGDNYNDMDMLKISDIPCLVFNDKFTLDEIPINNLITTNKPSPEGWADVIKMALVKIQKY